MIRLAIVGSTGLADSWRARIIIREVFLRYEPDVFISGGADGIDKMAESEARRRKMSEENIHIYLPKTQRWNDGYKPRNLLIAEDCTHLVRIALSNSKTYGSGWTRDRARELGKHTEEYVLCGSCKGSGVDAASDNVNWLPCLTCGGVCVKYSIDEPSPAVPNAL